MKNPFQKEDNTGALIAYIAIGALAAGAVTYLYLKKRSALKTAAKAGKEHALDYLKPHHVKKKVTTDLHELGKL